MEIIKQEYISYQEYLQYNIKNSKYNIFNFNYIQFLNYYGKKQKKIKMEKIWKRIPIELWFIIKDYFLINTNKDFRINILVKLTVTHDNNYSKYRLLKYVPAELGEIHREYKRLYYDKPLNELIKINF